MDSLSDALKNFEGEGSNPGNPIFFTATTEGLGVYEAHGIMPFPKIKQQSGGCYHQGGTFVTQKSGVYYFSH